MHIEFDMSSDLEQWLNCWSTLTDLIPFPDLSLEVNYWTKSSDV